MAAKKSRTAKKASKSTPAGVTVMLDTDTILTLNSAIEALAEFASAVIMASDDPAVRGLKATAKKGATKSATKSAKKRS